MAYEYAISFEIKSDSNYSERFRSLMEEIRKTAGKPFVWDETTSFVLITSAEAIGVLEHRLYSKSKLNADIDKLLVVDHANGAAVARGPFEYPNTLKAHFKSCVLK